MGRAPYRVVVIPFAVDAFVEQGFALFRDRGETGGGWRVLAGEGHRGEAARDAAARLGLLQAGIARDSAYVALDARAYPRRERGAFLIAQHAFAVQVDPLDLRVPAEREHCWLSYDAAHGLLGHAERDALWELRWGHGRRPLCR